MANFDLRRDSGRDSVGKAVASNARGLRFESSHRQTFISDIYLFEKTKIKKKRPGMWPIFLKNDLRRFSFRVRSRRRKEKVEKKLKS